MKRAALILLAAIFLGVSGFAGYQLYLQMSEYAEGEKSYSSLTDYVQIPQASMSPAPDQDENEPPDAPDILWPEVDFAALAAVNPGIVGWLYCEDTVINYPVAQADDNSYYLKHLFDGTYNANGCLFLDCRVGADFSNSHSIIYGHHMKNGSMFSSLDSYKKQKYFDEHPRLLLLTPEENYVIELFAGYVANVEEDAWNIAFADEIEFEHWLVSAISKSTFDSPVTPSPKDSVITLSTCSYEFNNARFVVLGVLQKY